MPPDNPNKKTQYGTGVQPVVSPAQTPQPGAAYTPPPAQQTPLPANVPAAGMAPTPTPPPDPYVGQTLVGRYYVEKKLGEGGMGAVYAATHVTLEKRVALKVLHGEFTRKPDLVERFLLEAKAASRIRHENVIDISDFGQTPDGSVFFAMEFLEGRDLHDLVARAKAKNQPLPWSRTRDIFLQVCAALSAAHSKGIVHRDLKPENIYLVTWAGHEDFVKLLDFGIAKMTEVDDEEGRKLTKTGMLFGTPEYMSPEQARGDKADHRVDVYAMGCILYQLLTGDVPFRADNFMGILSMHLTEMPPELLPEQLALVGAPPALASVVMKALAKEKEDRFQTIDEMADAVRGSEKGQGVTVPVSVPKAIPQRSKTNWTGSVQLPEQDDAEPGKRGLPLGLIIGALAGAIALGVVAFVVLGGSGDSSPAVADDPAADGAELAPLPAKVKVALTSQPSGARVIDVKDGAVLGTTPFDIDLPGSRDQMRLRLEMAGYKAQVLMFVPDQDVVHAVELTEGVAGQDTAEPEVVVVPQEPRTRPSGKRPKPRPDKPVTDLPRPEGDKPRPEGDKPRPEGDKPRPEGDKPRPDADKPRPDKPKPEGDKPKPEGDKPKPDADKPKPDADKPKPDGDKPGDPKIKNPFETAPP